MRRKVVASQIGPRQFELPPNMPECESPGQKWTLNSSPLTFHDQGCSLW